jgi:hypothetical protein
MKTNDTLTNCKGLMYLAYVQLDKAQDLLISDEKISNTDLIAELQNVKHGIAEAFMNNFSDVNSSEARKIISIEEAADMWRELVQLVEKINKK